MYADYVVWDGGSGGPVDDLRVGVGIPQKERAFNVIECLAVQSMCCALRGPSWSCFNLLTIEAALNSFFP